MDNQIKVGMEQINFSRAKTTFGEGRDKRYKSEYEPKPRELERSLKRVSLCVSYLKHVQKTCSGISSLPQ